ncbi:MAG: hypothetical protein WBI28_06670 [Candidatus Omnitrophota bacterium]
MISPNFKKTIFISLLGHITAFSIFTFSFGNKIQIANYANISSWGQVLKGYDLRLGNNYNTSGNKKLNFESLKAPEAEKEASDYLLPRAYSKPFARLAMQDEKEVFSRHLTENQFPKRRKEAVVMFYPALPYHFILYFKDRQVVHIQLDYNAALNVNKKNIITVRRKISSGNLEADLLCMRYIEHYLSIGQDRQFLGEWKTVKIELQPKR